MTSFVTKRARLAFCGLAAGLCGCAGSPAFSQLPAPYREDAGTALSRHLRTLSDEPQNIGSLVGAGKAAMELGDTQAAVTFFARAEEIAPRDGNIKADLGSAFVQLEQPEAALRFFSDALSLGVPERRIAGDRGLAYDILGDPRRAQRDYQLALSGGDDPEVRRRLALSLAISGDRDAALKAIDAQLRTQDRAAWRTRAFVLALTGDLAEATRGVEQAMPAQASAMRPFFARLPALKPADRALAVHFGRFPGDGQPVELAELASDIKYPAPPAITQSGRPDGGQPALGTASTPTPTPPAGTAQRRTARERRGATADLRANMPPRSSQRRTTQSFAAATVAGEPQPRPAAVQPQPRPTAAQPQPRRQPAIRTVEGARRPAFAFKLASPPPAPQAPAPKPSTPIGIALAPSTAPGFSISDLATPSRSQMSASPPAAAPAPALSFADIAASITSLRDASPFDAGSSAGPPPVASGPVVVARPVPIKRPPAASATIESKDAAKSPATRKASAEPVQTAALDKPAAKGGADKKAEDKKPPAKKTPPAPKAPSRVWVQVAGGAEKSDLDRQFIRLKSKAPKLLGSKTAWTTPLRATNRLLVGPFKSSQEAQDFVNQLAKLDISSFSWTSPAGQEIEKLALK